MNDLSMFQYAAHTIAMGNHAKGLEPFTEYVTAEVEKGGIAQAIRHYGLDGRGGQDTQRNYLYIVTGNLMRMSISRNFPGSME